MRKGKKKDEIIGKSRKEKEKQYNIRNKRKGGKGKNLMRKAKKKDETKG